MKTLTPKPCAQLAEQIRPHVDPATALVGIYTGACGWPSACTPSWASPAAWARSTSPSTATIYASKGLHASPKKTEIPFDVDGAHVILVDDVLYTGRTTAPRSTSCSTSAARRGSSSPCSSTAAGANCRSPRATAPHLSVPLRASRTSSCSATRPLGLELTARLSRRRPPFPCPPK